MNIGSHTFAEFKTRAAEFHGYPAPGLLIGAYMVEKAKQALPEGTLFEALVETGKCLPDSVQLLTLCSTGNSWMKVMDLGRIALSLYDKYTGVGYRVYVDVDALAAYPEIKGWLFKSKPKREQDTDKLFAEIEQAGDTIFSMTPIRVDQGMLGHSHGGPISVCPVCAEPYPENQGERCLGCRGLAPFTEIDAQGQALSPALRLGAQAPRVTGLDHLVLTVNSIDQSLEFYTGLGLTAITTAQGRTALVFGGQRIHLHELGKEYEPKAARPMPGTADICLLTTTPVASVADYAHECGMEVVQGPVVRMGAAGKLLSLYLRDPDGNLVEMANALDGACPR